MDENKRETLYFSTINLTEHDEEEETFSESNLSEELHKTKNTSINVLEEVPHFILVYKETNNDNHESKRKYFENELKNIGLLLSHEKDEKLNFLKIHAPTDVLCRYCEIMKMRMPIKQIPGLNAARDRNTRNVMKKTVQNLSNYIDNRLEVNLDENSKWTAEFSIQKDYLFDMNSANFFSYSDKSFIINFILERGRFSEKPQDIGIKKLLNEDVYKAYYPLHDGCINTEGSRRKFFLEEWGSVKKFYKYQPIDDIKNYFGVKFALYFTWLGFYTIMLIPASIIGILCMIYGFLTLSSNNLSNDVCDKNTNIMMCPQCDKYCDYWYISDGCAHAKISHLFDNYSTVFFGLFMSIWSAIYVELWKRYSAEITHKWGLTNFDLDTEHPRPEYLARLANYKKKFNFITNQEEPVVPFCKQKLPTLILSFSFALLWVFLAIGAVFGVVIYRMAGVATGLIFDKSSAYTSFAVPITAGLMNLICITVLNVIYDNLAFLLTKIEYHRTQVEFDNSYTLKIYMFQFVNFYSSLFYIAFLKGKFIGYPMKYNRVFGFRQEECSLGGCMMELFLQLAIIMIGKQALNGVIEILIPLLQSSMKRNDSKKEINIDSTKQWTDDYNLMEWDSKGLFSEYLEMIIQYGFITLFVVAFPLAPLFALINNIFETRLDAKKFIKYYRRPIAQRIKNIGIWFNIIEALGRLGIVSNAIIIAFSSNYIPLLFYMSQNPENGDIGFLNSSLSYFDVKDFSPDSRPIQTKFDNVSECRYAAYRNPYWDEKKYKKSSMYWQILVARLAFIVVYQNIVSFIVMFLQWAIPDVPEKLKEQIKREALRTSDYIIEQETNRHKEKKISQQSSLQLDISVK